MFAFRLTVLFLALMIDRVIGDPPWLWKWVPHPVVWIGKAISFADATANRSGASPRAGRLSGLIVILALLALSLLAGFILSSSMWQLGLAGLILEAIIVAVFLAQKSLHDHVVAVASALEETGLEEGRVAVSMIVGRDPNTLDEAGVSRAAIESLAENFSDGITAPVFWYVLLGLPGLLAYKTLNTADSMIGHKSEKYLYFGWASARLDDLANWLPARLSAVLIAAVAFIGRSPVAGKRAMKVSLRDHGLHRSPNAGWPEGAMAGAIDLQLAGPRIYGGQKVEEPMMNANGRGVANANDIRAGLKVYRMTCNLLGITVGGAALLALM